MNITNFVFAFVILGQSLQGVFANASEHVLAASVIVSDENSIESGNRNSVAMNEGECSDSSCHKDATCIVMGADLFDCQCNGDLVGDGITSCDVAESPSAMSSSSVELERELKRRRSWNPTMKKKKKKTAAPSASPAPSSLSYISASPSKAAMKNKGEKKKKKTAAPLASPAPSSLSYISASPSKAAMKKKEEKKKKNEEKMKKKSSAPSEAPAASFAPV